MKSNIVEVLSTKRLTIGTVAQFLSEEIDSICKERGWSVIEKEIQSDHVHLFLSFPPSFSIKGRKKYLSLDEVEVLRSRVALGEKKSSIVRDFGISRETLTGAK